MRLIFAALVAGFVAPLALAQRSATSLSAPTIDALFSEPEIRSVEIAPDGQHLAFLSPIKGRVSVVLFDLATGKVELLARAADENIKAFFWKDNDTVVYEGDIGGNESSSILAISLRSRRITRLAESYQPNVDSDGLFAGVIDPLKFVPGSILVYGRSSYGSGYVDLSWLNIRTGERKSVPGADTDTSGWLADSSGQVRARLRIAGNRQYLDVVSHETGLFQPIADWSGALGVFGQEATPFQFSADGELLYIAKKNPGQGSSLHAYNTRTRKWGDALYTVPNGDILSVTLSWDRSRLLALRYMDDRVHTHFFDAEREHLQKQIDASLPPGSENTIRSISQDGKLVAVAATSDVEPGIYYLLDLRAKPRLVKLGRVLPQVDSASLLPMKPIEYHARDGLLIHGYLTLPRQAGAGRVPLIINPHGGPFGIRDAWGFNPEVQLFASRGYAVLQPNYRGSGGYGLKFLQAGAREWGGKMQDDLSDAVKWAIDQGIADPDRVAIVGASYGGYAALAGVTFTPELYRCAVNYVGVSDLTIIASLGKQGRFNELFAHDWVGDRDLMEKKSPVNFVQNIRVPTLHAYGENDPRVDIKNWDELQRELKRYGKTYEYLHEENEGHGFRNEPARIRYYHAVDAFLQKNLAPVGYVKVGPDRVIEPAAKTSSAP